MAQSRNVCSHFAVYGDVHVLAGLRAGGRGGTLSIQRPDAVGSPGSGQLGKLHSLHMTFVIGTDPPGLAGSAHSGGGGDDPCVIGVADSIRLGVGVAVTALGTGVRGITALGAGGSGHDGLVGMVGGEDNQIILGSLFQTGTSSGEKSVADRAGGMGFHTVLSAGRLLLSVDSQGVRHQGEALGVEITAAFPMAGIGLHALCDASGGCGDLACVLVAKGKGYHFKGCIAVLAGIARHALHGAGGFGRYCTLFHVIDMLVVSRVDITANLADAVLVIIMDAGSGGGDNFLCGVCLFIKGYRCHIGDGAFLDAVGGFGHAGDPCLYSFHVGASIPGAGEGRCSRTAGGVPLPGGVTVVVAERSKFLSALIPTTIFALIPGIPLLCASRLFERLFGEVAVSLMGNNCGAWTVCIGVLPSTQFDVLIGVTKGHTVLVPLSRRGKMFQSRLIRMDYRN